MTHLHPTFDEVIRTERVLNEVSFERAEQHYKWGEQNHPMGTGPDRDMVGDRLWRAHSNADAAELAKERTEEAAQDGTLTFEHILTEEYFEALAEEDPKKLRVELIQVAAVAVAMVEKIDRDAKAVEDAAA